MDLMGCVQRQTQELVARSETSATPPTPTTSVAHVEYAVAVVNSERFEASDALPDDPMELAEATERYDVMKLLSI